ncbi:MAG: hypothetical protein ABSB56_08730 [Nitrososphaerales archaeon]|jgi:hypothetical protein
MKFGILSVAVLLLLILAFVSWKTYLSTPDPNLTPSLGNPLCAGIAAKNLPLAAELQACKEYLAPVHYSVFFAPKWVHAELAEGLTVLAGLVVAASVGWPMPEMLRRPRRLLQDRIKVVLMIVTILGLAWFAFVGVMDVTLAVREYENYSIPYISSVMGLWVYHSFLTVSAGIGLLAGGFSFGLLRLDEGILAAFQWSIWLVSCAIVFFLSGIAAFDFGELGLYITTFSSSWRVFGFPILSNLFCWMVSAFLFQWSVSAVKRRTP